jgi:hypothetical protein
MKKLIYTLTFVLILNSAFLIQNCQSQWMPTNNGLPTGTNVQSLTKNSSYIFAGSSIGIFRYAGNGWSATSMPAFNVRSVVTNGDILFAGTNSNGIYRSTDNGAAFTQVSALTSEVVLAVSGGLIFAGTVPFGVYISTNNGTNWTQTSLNNQSVKSFGVNGNNIFAGTMSGGVFLSTNNGTTWTQTSLNNQAIRSIAINGSNVFAGTGLNGIYKSANNGSTWTQTSINTGRYDGLTALNNNIFASGDGGIFHSPDNGVTWIPRNEGNPGGFNTFLFASNAIMGGGPNGVYYRFLSEMIGIQNISTEIPSAYSLSQNYPNPFNPTTKIRFAIPSMEGSGFSRGLVRLTIYDVMGREVQTLVNESLQPGTYEATFDGSNYSSGIYFYRLETNNIQITRKCILLK